MGKIKPSNIEPSKLAQMVTILTCIQEVLCLDYVTEYADRGCLLFPVVASDKCMGITLI
jgi:hypothetical protein